MSFVWPWLLAALVAVPLVLLLALWFDRRRSKYAVAFTNLDVLASVATARRRPWRWVPLALFLLALASASAALARPKTKIAVPSDRATIVLLVGLAGRFRRWWLVATPIVVVIAAFFAFVSGWLLGASAHPLRNQQLAADAHPVSRLAAGRLARPAHHGRRRDHRVAQPVCGRPVRPASFPRR